MFAEHVQQHPCFTSSVFPLALSNTSRTSETALTPSSNSKIKTKLSDSEAQLLADCSFAKIQRQQSAASAQIEQVIPILKRGRSKQKACDRIMQLMLSYPGAFVPSSIHGQNVFTGKQDSEKNTVYFLELCEESGDTVYLCRSSFFVSTPLQSWYSDRVIGLKSHAITRLLTRSSMRSASDSFNLEELARYLLELANAQAVYLDGYPVEVPALIEHGWCMSIAQDKARAILTYREGLPIVLTIAKSIIAGGEHARAEMLPPKSIFKKPRMHMDLGRVLAV